MNVVVVVVAFQHERTEPFQDHGRGDVRAVGDQQRAHRARAPRDARRIKTSSRRVCRGVARCRARERGRGGRHAPGHRGDQREERVCLLVFIPDLRDALEVHGVPCHQALHRRAERRRWRPEMLVQAGRFPGNAVVGGEAPRGVVVVHERVEGEHQEDHRDAGKRRDAPHGRDARRLGRHRGGERAPRTESWRRNHTRRLYCRRSRAPRPGAGVAPVFLPYCDVDRTPFEGARRSCRSESRWRPPTMGTCTTTSICRCAIGRRDVASRAANDRTPSRVVGGSRAERLRLPRGSAGDPDRPDGPPTRSHHLIARVSANLARL